MVSLSGPPGNECLLDALELLCLRQKTVHIERHITTALQPGEG
jgi:hypothetical protein